MSADQLIHSRVARQLAGIGTSTMNTWAFEGYLDEISVSAGPGAARRFTREGVVALVIMAKLRDLNVPLPEIMQIVRTPSFKNICATSLLPEQDVFPYVLVVTGKHGVFDVVRVDELGALTQRDVYAVRAFIVIPISELGQRIGSYLESIKNVPPSPADAE